MNKVEYDEPINIFVSTNEELVIATDTYKLVK